DPVKRVKSRGGSVAMLYSPGPLWPATRRAPSSRPPPASPPARLRSPSGMRPGGAQGRRGFAPADLATHGAHHHGCAAPARRGARHGAGGAPGAGQLPPLPGAVEPGRRPSQDPGCASCHKVAGEPFADQARGGPGPELTGMGSHHPPAYFVESILNPDAVLVDGPGYVSPESHSTMPTYPDLTITQLEDLVAYLSSLTSGDPHAGHAMPMAGVPDSAERPEPPATPARSFFMQTYDVQPGKMKDFEAWFAREGARKFLAVDGLVGIDTYVDGTRPSPAVTTAVRFRD